MNAEAVLRVLDDVQKEVEKRQAGVEPDRRFDLALDVLADLDDELEEDA